MEIGEEEYDDSPCWTVRDLYREDMEDLRITNLQELIERIEKLHRSLDNKYLRGRKKDDPFLSACLQALVRVSLIHIPMVHEPMAHVPIEEGE